MHTVDRYPKGLLAHDVGPSSVDGDVIKGKSFIANINI